MRSAQCGISRLLLLPDSDEMAIKIQCSSCGASLRAPDHALGQTFACPKCKQSILVGLEEDGLDDEELKLVEDDDPDVGSVFDVFGGDYSASSATSGEFGNQPPHGGLVPQQMPMGSLPPRNAPPGWGNQPEIPLKQSRPWGVIAAVGSMVVLLIIVAIAWSFSGDDDNDRQANAAKNAQQHLDEIRDRLRDARPRVRNPVRGRDNADDEPDDADDEPEDAGQVGRNRAGFPGGFPEGFPRGRDGADWPEMPDFPTPEEIRERINNPPDIDEIRERLRNRPDFPSARPNSAPSDVDKYATVDVDSDDTTEFVTVNNLASGPASWQPVEIPHASIPFEYPLEDVYAPHVDFSPVIFSQDGQYAAVASFGTFNGVSEVLIFDLVAQEIIAKQTINSSRAAPLAISPDNQTVITGHQFGMLNGESRIFFWNINKDQKQLDYVKGWESTEFPKFAAYLNDHEVVMCAGRNVAVFDVERNQALKVVKGSSVSPIAGGHRFAVQPGRANSILDLMEGTRFVFSRNSETSFYKECGISADGSMLAITTSQGGSVYANTTRVFDTRNDTLVTEFSVLESLEVPRFVGNKYLMTPSNLFDYELLAKVAEFEAHRPLGNAMLGCFHPAATYDGRTVVYIHQDDPDEAAYSLVTSTLLDDHILDAVNEYTSLPSLLVGPGTPIQLILDQSVPGGVAVELREYLTEAGLVISNKQEDLAVEIWVEDGQKQTTEVVDAVNTSKSLGHVTYVPKISHFYMTLFGREIANLRQGSSPNRELNVRPGESLVGAANRACQPSAGFFIRNIPTRTRLFDGDVPKIRVTSQGLEAN